MNMWMMIIGAGIIFLAISFLFVGTRFIKFLNQSFVSKLGKLKKLLLSCLISSVLLAIAILTLDFINAVVCFFYVALIWCTCDLLFYIIKKLFHVKCTRYYSGFAAIILSIIVLSIGWYQAHYVYQTNYALTSQKDISDLRIVMFADSHVGSTFNAEEFEEHIERIQAQEPDIVVIVGDYVDDSTTKEDMILSTRLLGKLKTTYGVYYVFGNHDKGYYSSERRGYSSQELTAELEKNNITILQDNVIPLNDSYYLIGRADFSIKERKSMKELVSPLDKNKYMIVLDHQPADYENQEKSKVDLVLSGHTHGGQLFPFNQVGKLIGVNDLVYGLETRDATNFIVTSGISDWELKFKTGTKSEFVVIDISKS